MEKARHKKTAIIIVAILIIILGLFSINAYQKYQAHEKLRLALCQDATNSHQMPAWYVDHTPRGKIVYAFSGYSGTTEDGYVNGVWTYNYREATSNELAQRFIGNRVYFVYSDDAVSKHQILNFTNDNFWGKYESSGMTFKC